MNILKIAMNQGTHFLNVLLFLFLRCIEYVEEIIQVKDWLLRYAEIVKEN